MSTHLFDDPHVVDDDSRLLDVLPHQLVVVGREDGAAAALQQVPGHPVGYGASV